MAEEPRTRSSLLIRIRESHDREAWDRFVEIYAPLVYGFARKRGLQDADAADLTQEVLRSISRTMGDFAYDPERGSFRGWLYTVARNKLINLQARRQPALAKGGTTVQQLLEKHAAPADVEEWEQDYERRLFHCAAEMVRQEFEPASWQAFWQTAVDGKKPAHVAGELKISVGAVYIAKSRIVARLKEKVLELQVE